jgi:hypothetical protein
MTRAWDREEEDEPDVFEEVEEEVEEKGPPKPKPLNRFAFASLLMGSVALIWASIPYLKILAVILGIAGLITGFKGINAYPLLKRGKIWSYAGMAGSFLAVCLGGYALIQGWYSKIFFENQLTQVPLRSSMGLVKSRGSVEPETGWVDAGRNAVQQGDVRVRLAAIAFAPVDFKKPPEPTGQKKVAPPKTAPKKPPDKYLIVNLRISNAGAGQLIQYISWANPSPTEGKKQVSLQDNTGKKYPLKTFPADKEINGQIARASIPPTKWADDVLVFEGDPGQVEYLHLELPSESVGGKGSFRLQIPGRMIGSR